MSIKRVFFVIGFFFALSLAYGESYFTVGYEYGFLWEGIKERGAELKTNTSGQGVSVELTCLSAQNVGVFFHGRIVMPQKAKSVMSGGSEYNPDDYNTSIVQYASCGIGVALRAPLGGLAGFRAGLGFNYAFSVSNETKRTYSGGRFSYLEEAQTKHLGLAGNAGLDLRIVGGWFLHTGVSFIFDFANMGYPSFFESSDSSVSYEQSYSLFVVAPRVCVGFRF
jgi:hypothetical protein